MEPHNKLAVIQLLNSSNLLTYYKTSFFRFDMASQSEQETKVLEIPNGFYVGHLIGSKGKTIRDLQKFTRTKINIQKGNFKLLICRLNSDVKFP